MATAKKTTATKEALRELVRRAASRNGVPGDLAVALITQESALNPFAVSRVGAMGLGQLMPATAKDLSVGDPFDPGENLDGSMRYLASMIRLFGEKVGVAAYNAGPGNVRKYKSQVPPFEETQNYVKKIRERMGREYLS